MRTLQKLTTVCVALLLALTQDGFGFSLVGHAQKTNDSFPKELDEYIAAAVRDSEIPGLGIAIVKDGKVIVAKGYGVREMGKPEPVNEDTIFDTASLTKSFTATAIASLVDEKKIMWDAPVRRYLPTIEFPDPYLTANITIRDLLAHRTGLHAANGPAFYASLDRPQLLGLLKNVRIVAPFRAQFVYSNIGYTAAGEAAAVAAGTTWADLINTRLIEPLGMKRTTPVFKSAPGMGNIASGHALIYSTGVQIVTPREGLQRDVTGPAAAIQSSPRDMATWMIFQLGDGTFGGKRILSAATLADIHAPQTLILASDAFRKSRQIGHFGAYCMGWQVYYYRGNRMIWHTGSGDGQAAMMALLPESQLGVVVLSNSWKGGAALNLAIVSRIQDHYLNLPTRDYVAEFHEQSMRSTQQQMEGVRKFQASQIANTKPTLPLAEYAGLFRDQLGLEVKLWLEGNQLKLQYGGGEPATVTHWNFDTFLVRWDNPLHADQRSALAQFVLSPRGNVSEVQMEFSGERIIARR